MTEWVGLIREPESEWLNETGGAFMFDCVPYRRESVSLLICQYDVLSIYVTKHM